MNLAGPVEVEAAYLMRMQEDAHKGLILQCRYDDYWSNLNIRLGYEKFKPNHDLYQLEYSGYKLAELAEKDKLSLQECTFRDWVYGDKHKLVFIHETRYVDQFKVYIEKIIYEERIVWCKQPGFAHPGTIAWILPFKSPVLIFRPTVPYAKILTCKHYKLAMQFVEYYLTKASDEGVDISSLPVPLME